MARKRYTRKYRNWSPRFKFRARDANLLNEFEHFYMGRRRSRL